MFYERELQFLQETFNKCRIKARILAPEDILAHIEDDAFRETNDLLPAARSKIKDLIGQIDSNTIYKYTDDFKVNYTLLRLPEAPYENILVLGPYLATPLSSRQILEIGERKGISPKKQKLLEDYYLSIPALPEGSHLFLMLDTFCERLWGASAYSIIDISRDIQSPASPIIDVGGADFDDIAIKMKAMEQRYHYENELIQATSLGHIQKVNELLTGFLPNVFEMRTADPLRNLKNYCIIMNTLLRKAAEKGGVHPMYIDSASSANAIKIEQLTSFEDCYNHMRDMFRGYCRLVRKHSMKNLSPLVQKVIILIDSDLSAGLSLSSLAESQKVSCGYLSATFKKETGQTITEYIRDKRIAHAKYLLSTTHLQIQTVALHCGIMDVQYFSKQFKKQIGMTPKEYRELMKKSTV